MIGGVAIAALAIVVGLLLARDSEYTITGTLTVNSGEDACSLSEGYEDIGVGTEVLITDESDKTLAIGELGEGKNQEGEDGGYTGCEFAFEISGVADSKIYGVTVADRGTSRSDKSELENDDWQVGLTLGP